MKNKKIYDCFTFFNELDLLEIRLIELYDVVDHFVIVEANKTFSGKNKPFNFEKNKSRYKKWMDKIIYVKLDDMPKVTPFFGNVKINKLIRKFDKKDIYRKIKSSLSLGRWRLQNFQRDQIIRGLKNCCEDDLIFVSDVDEIWDKNKLSEVYKNLKKHTRIGLGQDYYAYYLNGLVVKDGKPFGGPLTKCCLLKDLKKKYRNSPQYMRARRKFIFKGDNDDMFVVNDAGWHFSYLGGEKKIIQKMKNLSQGGFDINKSLNMIKNDYWPDDKSMKIEYIKNISFLPNSIIKNKDKWKKYIKYENFKVGRKKI